jgi:hypothetical protein
MCRRVRLTARLGGTELQVLWRQTSVLGDARKHLRTDFFSLMKGEHEIWPAVPVQRAM